MAFVFLADKNKNYDTGTPGPGQYHKEQPLKLEPSAPFQSTTGRIPVTTKQIKEQIKQLKQKDFVPGPGHYHNVPDLYPQDYFEIHKSNKGQYRSKSKRFQYQKKDDNSNIGPGSYYR